jgi:uncharacterized protein (TIGR00269 family)
MGKNVSVCDICIRREAFYFRPYSGRRLCRKCFATSIEDKVRATIAKYNMLSYDDKIAVAVSGGKDSVSLLHVLAKVEYRYPKTELIAITVDEGIKGYRDEALKIAAETCRELGFEHQTISFRKLFGRTFDQMMKRVCGGAVANLTPCAYCGVLRRKALNVVARDIGADKLATGHTLDDETQTILLNIFHGDVLRIAKEKPVTDLVHPKLVRRIKPFCEVPERETALYAFVKGIRFQSTPCPYSGEALRNDARAILNGLEEKHPGIMFSILKSIERIRPTLEEMAKIEGLSECVECGEPTTGSVCRTCQMRKQIG